jgi:hypothetical protein
MYARPIVASEPRAKIRSLIPLQEIKQFHLGPLTRDDHRIIVKMLRRSMPPTKKGIRRHLAVMLDSMDQVPPRITLKLSRTEPADSAPSEAQHQPIQSVESEAYLQRIAALAEIKRMANFGYWSFDLRARNPDFSAEACRLQGFASDLSDLSLPDYRTNVLADDRSRITRMVHAALTQGESFDAQLRLVRGDGGLRWLRVIGRRAPRRYSRHVKYAKNVLS